MAETCTKRATPRAARRRSPRRPWRAGLKALAAGFIEHPDQIDAGLRPVQRAADGGGVLRILAWTTSIWPTSPSMRQAVAHARIAHGDPDPIAAPGQRPDDLAPDKARTAENRHQSLHRSSFLAPAGGRDAVAIDEARSRAQSRGALTKPERRPMRPASRDPAERAGPGGGIGRRAGFRCQWLNGRGGSSPFLGTTLFRLG